MHYISIFHYINCSIIISKKGKKQNPYLLTIWTFQRDSNHQDFRFLFIDISKFHQKVNVIFYNNN